MRGRGERRWPNGREAREFVPFENGFSSGTGFTTLTNYSKFGGITPVGDLRKGGRSCELFEREITYDITQEGVPGAILRLDFTQLPGDANLTIEFPDGQVFTPANTPTLESAELTDPDAAPQDGDVPIFYRHYIYESDGSEPSLKEAVFSFNGPCGMQEIQLFDENGEPAEVSEYFAQGPIPVGTYKVTITTDNPDILNLEPEFLAENASPELTSINMEELTPDVARLSWEVNDPNGDDAHVRFVLSHHLDRLEDGVAVGAVDGYSWQNDAHSLDFSLDDIENFDTNRTTYLSICMTDGFDPPTYTHIGTFEPNNSDTIPEVTGLVAVPDDAQVTLYWEALDWTPANDDEILVGYAIVIDEVGLNGVLEDTKVVSAGPEDTELLVTGLQNGKAHRVRIGANVRRDADTVKPGPLSAPIDFMPGGGNCPPQFRSSPVTQVVLGEIYSYDIVLVDPDGDPISLSLTEGPTGATLTGANNAWTLSYQTTGDKLDLIPITLVVSDDQGGEDRQQYTISIVEPVALVYNPVIDSIPPSAASLALPTPAKPQLPAGTSSALLTWPQAPHQTPHSRYGGSTQKPSSSTRPTCCSPAEAIGCFLIDLAGEFVLGWVRIARTGSRTMRGP